MHSDHRARVAGLFIAVTLVFGLIGCAGEPAEPVTGSASQSDVDAARKALAQAGPADEKTAATWQEKVDEFMATCMRKNGFDYTPPPDPVPVRVSLGLDDDEFVARYGWGISTLIAEDLHLNERQRAALGAPADLSPGAQKQWNSSQAECRAEAQKTFGAGPDDPRLTDRQQEILFEVQERAEADPRIADAKKDYARCVATRGYDGDRGEALQQKIFDAVGPFSAKYAAAYAEAVDGGRDPGSLRVEEVLTATEMGELRRVQRLELELAAVDANCGKRLYPVVDAIHKEYRDKFLAGG